MKNSEFVLPLNRVGLQDISIAGGKNASLGEMIQHLSHLNISIPNGFVITVNGYKRFIEASGLAGRIRQIIDDIDFSSIESLRRHGLKIRQLIRNSTFPNELSELIIEEYFQLSRNYGQDETDVAVRSSATAEDLPDASFAGQQETYLNVRGPASLIDAVRNCFASLFTDRAISYRESLKYSHLDVGLSVCIQKMVRSDLACSGVAFSLDTETGYDKVVVINASYGLGEMIVQGSVSPDEFILFKPRLNGQFSPIIEKKSGVKDKMMVYGDNPDERVTIIPVDKAMQSEFCLQDDRIIQLARWVVEIENYYTLKRGRWCPMDVEWAVDGLSGELFIVQARPETIHSRRDPNSLTTFAIGTQDEPTKVLLRGIAIGDKIATGKVSIMHSLDKRVSAGHEFREGGILVTDMTDPDWEPVMKRAAAIITNKGGRTCHAAIVAREMGVPAIIGCGSATEVLSEQQLVTVSCAEGDEGKVYEGARKFSETQIDLAGLPKIRTALMLNVGSPAMAFQFAQYPHKGVGLARLEFIINNYIKVHPLALLQHRKLDDSQLSGQIQIFMKGFESEEEYFVRKLSYGIAKIASAFDPEKVIVRFSDFKSNEYCNLLGGKYFEPHEENPMIGWRGASRYYSEEYKPAFALECRAIKCVREEMGLHNVAVMVPFCRTVDELLRVKSVMEEFGLKHRENGLEIYLMAEIPSNIVLGSEFAKHIDGFSIGSNDLTQLMLGLDRDSSLVTHLYDERNSAVKSMIRMLIKTAKQENVRVGICGQGPSDFPDFAQFLVEEGIDSISITPDSLPKTINAIHEIETALERRRRDVERL